jgi:hypothetical protein
MRRRRNLAGDQQTAQDATTLEDYSILAKLCEEE